MKFKQAIDQTTRDFLTYSVKIHTGNWQGINTRDKPEMSTWELLHVMLLGVEMPRPDLDYYRDQIGPNLPWADNHFERERVSGQPLNPGETWKEWPYGHAAARALDADGQFNHSYAERYWPRYAGHTESGKITEYEQPNYDQHFGIRGAYGDLMDLCKLLVAEPLTRQAYLPVWFPEDTGNTNAGRKPCTIGYHFIMRNGKLDVTYHIRSCDLIRHFRDDIYLTVRLVLWVLQTCCKIDGLWSRVTPGRFNMVIGSLHCFANDMIGLRNDNTQPEQ